MTGGGSLSREQDKGRRGPQGAEGPGDDSRLVLSGIGFALLSASAFAAIAPVAKLAYERGAEPVPLLALRFSMACLLLVLIRGGSRRSLTLPRATAIRLLLLGGIAFAAETWLFFAALEITPAGIASLVFFSFPLITAVIAFVFGLEPFGIRTVIALLLGSAGVVSIFGIGGIEIRGLLLALGAATAVAVYFVLAGIFIKGVASSVAATWTAGGAAITLSAAAFASGQALPGAAVPAGIALGVLTTFAFIALYAAIGRIGAPRAAVAQMFEPVFTVILAAAFLGEAITGRIVIGALLIVSALPVLSASGRRKQIPPPPDSI